MTLLVGSCEMTYNVLSGTLNTTIPPYSGNVAPTKNVSSGTINTTIPPYSGNVAPTNTHTDLPQHNFKGSAALILWSARGIASGMQGVTTYFITIKLRRFKLGFNLLLRCHVECSWIGSGRSSLWKLRDRLVHFWLARLISNLKYRYDTDKSISEINQQYFQYISTRL